MKNTVTQVIVNSGKYLSKINNIMAKYIEKDPNKTLENFQKKGFNTNHIENLQVKIRASQSVSIGMFKADPFIPGGYIAHPDSIKALRKDIFTLDFDLDEFQEIVTCSGCKNKLDKQFWIYCPYCGAEFEN